jgi:hypothetical protein
LGLILFDFWRKYRLVFDIPLGFHGLHLQGSTD